MCDGWRETETAWCLLWFCWQNVLWTWWSHKKRKRFAALTAVTKSNFVNFVHSKWLFWSMQLLLQHILYIFSFSLHLMLTECILHLHFTGATRYDIARDTTTQCAHIWARLNGNYGCSVAGAKAWALRIHHCTGSHADKIIVFRSGCRSLIHFPKRKLNLNSLMQSHQKLKFKFQISRALSVSVADDNIREHDSIAHINISDGYISLAKILRK